MRLTMWAVCGSQLMNAMRFLRSTTGRGVLVPPLSAKDAKELAAVEEQLTHIKRQYFALASRIKPPMASPEQLTAGGRWADYAKLQLAARERGRFLVSLVPRVQQSSGAKSAAQLNLASKLSGSMLTLLLTVLPPQRSRSLYECRLYGVPGMDDPTDPCLEAGCKITGCRGIRLRREGVRTFTWIIHHHKNRGKAKTIPDQVLCEETRTDPILLDVLETVGLTWPHECVSHVNCM